MNPSAPTFSLLHDESAWRRFREAMAAAPGSAELLRAEAEPWLTAKPPTVVIKDHLAPSGSPHDYVSIAAYWWPDPKKRDGLPWIRRDGEVNPVFYQYDNQRLETLCHGVTRLALHAEASGSAAHVRQAARFLRTWFIDPDTIMNPHLRYAQFVPGRDTGRHLGIIDTTSLVFALDAATRLPLGEHWTAADLDGLKRWFSAYLDWLLQSDFGRAQSRELGNHGMWYDAQVVAYALFCGREAVARRQIETTTVKRADQQLTRGGAQPHELARTLSFTYCTYNLLAFACVARMAKPLGLDLWDRKAKGHGASYRDALRWMLPYFAGEAKWTHRQLKPFDRSSAAVLLNLAWQATGDDALLPTLAQTTAHPWQAVTFSKSSLTGRRSPRLAAGRSIMQEARFIA
jgi:Alginate lyase.